MNCEDVQEYVSALCDGEQVPPAAAEHVGVCEFCRERAKEYLELAVELRRLASLRSPEEVEPGAWKQRERNVEGWWGKGWETMRIPRFAFALLLIAIVALGSGLVMSKVRAQAQGTVLLVTYKLPDGRINRCALSLIDERQNLCAAVSSGTENSPTFILLMKTLAHGKDRVELGVHTEYKWRDRKVPLDIMDELKRMEGRDYWITPGQDLPVEIPGWGEMVLSGELMDHLPPTLMLDPDVQMDPKAGKLQIISPLLIRDKKVWFDFQGNAAMGQPGAAMYVRGKGLWKMSLSPLDGGVEAQVNLNRISFELNGHSYLFLMAAPVVRTDQRVWISLNENYRSPAGVDHYLEGVDLERWKEE